MKSNVLLAEPDSYLRKLIAKAFDHAGFNVLTADNAEHTLDQINAAMPEVLIIDLDNEGFEVMRHVRQSAGGNAVKIIVVTGDYDIRDTMEGKLADFFLLKPVMMSELTNLAIQLTTASKARATGMLRPLYQ